MGIMNRQLFETGLKEIQNTFKSEYSKSLVIFLWSKVQKIQDKTWNAIFDHVMSNFKPSFNCPLPVPADFTSALSDIHREDEKEWKKQREPDTQADYEGYKIYQNAVAELLKKWTGKEDFRLTTSHINGVFACEICFRNRCNGRTPNALRNGCPGYLSEDKAKEIEEKKKGVAV